MVNIIAPGSTFTAKISAAVATKDLGGQQIVVLGFMAGRGFFIDLQLLLNSFKQIIRHNTWNALRNHCIPERKLSDVTAVTEHMLDGVIGDRIAASVLYALLIEPVPEFGHGRAFVVAFEHFQHIRRRDRIGLKVLLVVDHIADGDRSAIELTLERVIGHAPDDLFSQIRRVVFRIALQDRFQDDAFRAFGNDLCGGHHLDAVLLQQ